MAELDIKALTPRLSGELRQYLRTEDYQELGTGGENSTPKGASGVRGVGMPGKVGVAEVVLGVDKQTGRTGLRKRFVKAPMSVTRPLYVDPSDPAHAVLYLRSTGGGLAENDRIRQRIALREDASATITTQAATNVHRMNAGLATQWVSFDVGERASLEYLPGHLTMFAGARLVQATEFSLSPSATLIASEITLAGRLARGECNEFDALSLSTRVTRCGRPLLSDRLEIIGGQSATDPMLWDQYPVWGTLLVVGSVGSSSSTPPSSLADLCHARLENAVGAQASTIRAGVSTLVGNIGALIRVAGQSSIAVRNVLHAVHDGARRELLGKPAFDLRTM